MSKARQSHGDEPQARDGRGGGKKALIFGVSGQDGAYLAQFLLSKGYMVSGTTRAEANARASLARLGIRDQVYIETLDGADLNAVCKLVERLDPDEVYNLAGQSSVSRSFREPLETFLSIGLLNLHVLEAIRLGGGRARMFSAGSSECFGDTHGQSADESTAFRPVSPYGVAKASAYWQVVDYREAYGLHACTGILYNHESPLRPEQFVTQKIARAAARIAAGSRERLMLGNTAVARDWGWAPEYVEAMWLMLQQDQALDLVLASGRTVTLQEFLAAAFATAGLDWREHVSVDQSLLRPTEIAIVRANTGKAHEVLGWRARHQAEDVARMMVAAAREKICGRG